jgi:predicted phage tail protein
VQAVTISRNSHDAARAVCRIGGVAAFGRVVVVGVVAPVEAVGFGGALDQRLLAARRPARRRFRHGAAGFRHAADVVHRQQVDVGQAALRQRGEVLHAVRIRFGEGQVLAAVFGHTVVVASEKSRTCSS